MRKVKHSRELVIFHYEILLNITKKLEQLKIIESFQKEIMPLYCFKILINFKSQIQGMFLLEFILFWLKVLTEKKTKVHLRFI